MTRCLALMLGDASSADDPTIDWKQVVAIASEHIIVRRLASRLTIAGVALPEVLSVALGQEDARIASTVDSIRALGDALHANGVRFMFPKAFQHWPDMGHDIDLLVDATPARTAEIVRRLRAEPDPTGLVNRVAGKRNWTLPTSKSPLEIHHGRTGLVGEYPRFALEMLDRRTAFSAGVARGIPVPAVEDAAIVRVIQRVYSHFNFRVGDIVSAVQFDDEGSDLDVIMERARALGIAEGVDILGRLTACARSGDLTAADLRVSPSDVARLLARRALTLARNGQWRSSARVALIPMLGAYVAGRRALRGLTSKVGRGPSSHAFHAWVP